MRIRVFVSPWAALAAGVLIYFLPGRSILFLLLPIIFHELGHLLALFLFHYRIEELRVEISGLCIRYSGVCSAWKEAAAALAGPLAGLIYACAAVGLGQDGEITAGISLLLSAFNMIPAQPLDGGRIAAALLDPLSAGRLGLVSAVLTAAMGLILLLERRGAALALAGLCLVLNQYPFNSKVP